MAKKELKQLEIIKQRMIEAGIGEEEALSLIIPLKEEIERRVCGLVWEHTTASIPDMEGKIPFLVPIHEKDIVNDINGNNHVLIEGENLLILMAMQYTHIDENGEGMIDVIYIDPPYNTGAVTFGYNDKFEKSEWLSMMNIRLKLARNLLKENGIICIQIDETYQAELKLLCNDIYNECNHINTIAVGMSNMSGPKVTHAINGKCFPKIKEYVLIYAKNNKQYKLAIPKEPKTTWDKEYNLIIPEFTKEMMEDVFIKKKALDKDVLTKLSLTSLKTYMKNEGIEEDDILWKNKNSFRIFASKPNTALLKKAKLQQFNTAVDIISNQSGTPKLIKTDFNRETTTARIELTNAEINSECYLGDLWTDIVTTGGIAQEGGVFFTNGKKPLKLIKRIINTIPDKNTIVFDFFAGSGTTGEAVLSLNEEDKGNRQFILCTSNEPMKMDNEEFQKAFNQVIERLKDSQQQINIVSDAINKSFKSIEAPLQRMNLITKQVQKLVERYPKARKKEDIPTEEYGICNFVTLKRMNNIFDVYKRNNLYYFKLEDSIEQSSIDEITINNMASKAVSYVALKENIYNTEVHKNYHKLYNADTEIVVVLDADLDIYDVEDEIADKAFTKENKKVYCSVSDRTTIDGIEYIPYPEEVLDTLKNIKKFIRREIN